MVMESSMISGCVPTASCMLERKLHTSPCTLRLSYRKSASSSKHWVKATIIRSLAPSLPEAIPCLSDVRLAPLVAFCFRWRYRSGSKSTISSMACPKMTSVMRVVRHMYNQSVVSQHWGQQQDLSQDRDQQQHHPFYLSLSSRVQIVILMVCSSAMSLQPSVEEVYISKRRGRIIHVTDASRSTPGWLDTNAIRKCEWRQCTLIKLIHWSPRSMNWCELPAHDQRRENRKQQASYLEVHRYMLRKGSRKPCQLVHFKHSASNDDL